MRLTTILLISFMALPALAGQTDLNSEAYAKKDKKEFNRGNVENCFQTELDLFEQVRGRLPSPDEADLVIDACMKMGNS